MKTLRAALAAGVIAVLAVAGGGAAAHAASTDAHVRFVEAAPGQPAINVVVVGGPTLVNGLTYPNSSPYMAVPPGTYNIELVAAGSNSVLVRIVGWHAVAGVSTTVKVFLGVDGHLAVDPMTDLAFTGSRSAPLVFSGLALLALGLVMVLSTRVATRRPSSASPR